MKAVAVVGVGALGRHHARIYSQLPQTRLEAVVDSNPQRAFEIGRDLGSRALEDYREVLDQVEAVSVAVPTESHAEIASAFLARGVDVLVEKPIASCLADADRILEAQTLGGARLHVGHSERFNPALEAVRPLIRRPGFFEIHRMGGFAARSLDIDVVLDLMIHDLDLILHLVPSRVSETRAAGVSVLSEKVDIANARVQFENGCVANLTASRISLEKRRKIRFFQPNEYISIDLLERRVNRFSLQRDAQQRPQVVPVQVEIGDAEPLRREIEEFLDDGPDGCRGQEARRALALAIRIKDDVERTQETILKNLESDQADRLGNTP